MIQKKKNCDYFIFFQSYCESTMIRLFFAAAMSFSGRALHTWKVLLLGIIYFFFYTSYDCRDAIIESLSEIISSAEV